LDAESFARRRASGEANTRLPLPFVEVGTGDGPANGFVDGAMSLGASAGAAGVAGFASAFGAGFA
jgi:hypothetical protein